MNDTRKKITLVISSLECGGAERVMSLLANHFADAGHAVSLILVMKNEIYFPVDPKVRVIAPVAPKSSSGAGSRVLSYIARVRKLRTAILGTNPDVVISFLDEMNILTLLACKGAGFPVIVSERTDPRSHKIGRFNDLMRRLTYPHADKLVFQSEGLLEWAAGWIRRENICIIPNPVMKPSTERDEALAFDPEGSKFVVGVGRLSKVKGFDMLVRAFSGAAADRPGWKLIILGDGEEKDSILDEVRKTGMEDRVIMPGAVKNTAVILKKCALFVMSSRYEGFPNALCEAMSCGLACISFDCPIGPARIIESGFNGILVPAGDVEKLKIEMGVLMDDAGERARLGANAAKITETLGGDRIMKMWDDLIIRIHQ